MGRRTASAPFSIQRVRNSTWLWSQDRSDQSVLHALQGFKSRFRQTCVHPVLVPHITTCNAPHTFTTRADLFLHLRPVHLNKTHLNNPLCSLHSEALAEKTATLRATQSHTTEAHALKHDRFCLGVTSMYLHSCAVLLS